MVKRKICTAENAYEFICGLWLTIELVCHNAQRKYLIDVMPVGAGSCEEDGRHPDVDQHPSRHRSKAGLRAS